MIYVTFNVLKIHKINQSIMIIKVTFFPESCGIITTALQKKGQNFTEKLLKLHLYIVMV